MNNDYLKHALNFVNQWDALGWNATADETAKVMYDDWMILPTSTIGDHIQLRLVEEGYVGPEQESRRLIVVASTELLEESNVKLPRILLEDMIVKCFRSVEGSWKTAKEIEEVIRQAVEAGVSRGMREFDVEGVTIPRYRGWSLQSAAQKIGEAMSDKKFSQVLEKYESREDSLGQSVFSAVRLSQDCEDCDLNDSLEALERALERGSPQQIEELEESVKARLEIIEIALEDRDQGEAMRDYYGTVD